jgi:SagB-type dehydrogenase family enzyme
MATSISMTENNFSQLYHQYSKRIRNSIPYDYSLWPDEWRNVYYKIYPRLPKIKLLETNPKYDLFSAIKSRSSKREFNSEKISLEKLSSLLEYSMGIVREKKDGGKSAYPSGDKRRAYPSGGARYPIEMYCLIAKAGKGLRNGLFHYDIKNHQLDVLIDKNFNEEDIAKITTYPFIKDSACLIFLTSVFWRSQNKYGQRGYRFCLIEAGHIGQNIYLLCEALNLKCCALGGMRISDETAEKFLNIDGITESLVYALAIGK